MDEGEGRVTLWVVSGQGSARRLSIELKDCHINAIQTVARTGGLTEDLPLFLYDQEGCEIDAADVVALAETGDVKLVYITQDSLFSLAAISSKEQAPRQEEHSVYQSGLSHPSSMQQNPSRYEEHQLSLDMSFKKLINLSPSLLALSVLTSVNLSGNCLSSLPQQLSQLESLTEVNLSNNRMLDIPSDACPTSLTSLNLSNNMISSGITRLSKLSRLKILILKQNPLVTLQPLGQSSFHNLKELDASSCLLREISEDLFLQLPNLELLDLAHNRLLDLPTSINSVSKLRVLRLGHNRLASLPNISTLSSLCDLNLTHNRLILVKETDEHEDAILRLPTSLTHLDLSNNKIHNLRGLSPRLSLFEGLQHLDVSRNRLHFIPSDIGSLTLLRHLDLTCNQLMSLPREIGKLANLQRFRCSLNPFRHPLKWLASSCDDPLLAMFYPCLLSTHERIQVWWPNRPLAQFEIPVWDVELPDTLAEGSRLGAGHQGKVYKGMWKHQVVAIKAIPDVRRFCQEVGVVRILNQRTGNSDLLQHCIRYHGFLIPGKLECVQRMSSPPCCLVMELAPHGSLSDILYNRQRRLREDQKLTICRNVAQAMLRLHSADYLHADLKPSNVLVMDTTTWWLKLADFGLSAHAWLTSGIASSRQEGLAETDGTLYMGCTAPEVISGMSPFTKKSDVFSYGMLMWEVFAQRKPFAGMSEEQICRYLSDHKRPDIPPSWPVAELIHQCLAEDPSSRPTFEMILRGLDFFLSLASNRAKRRLPATS